MKTYSCQIAIIGGGISGLWLLNRLRNAGYDALLFEKDSLGGKQTLASQGIIHSGIKYDFRSVSTPVSKSLAAMPGVWRACMQGKGPIDLRDVNYLSEHCYLFSNDSIGSKLTTFLAGKSINGTDARKGTREFPDVFKHEQFKGPIYRVEDMVVDVPALVRSLVEPYRPYIFKTSPEMINEQGKVTALKLDNVQSLSAECYIFTAGAGNEKLINNTPLNTIEMQRRPLQQVMLKGNLPSLFAHAISLKDLVKPRITFTTHARNENDAVWYLGGNLAEHGVGMQEGELIDRAKQEIQSLLPWVELDKVSWATLNVDRAEPAQKSQMMPDSPFVEAIDNCMVCWPTKLTLAPMLADEVFEKLDMRPRQQSGALPELPKAGYASAPWEQAFD